MTELVRLCIQALSTKSCKNQASVSAHPESDEAATRTESARSAHLANREQLQGILHDWASVLISSMAGAVRREAQTKTHPHECAR